MEHMNWLECVVGLVLGGGISVVANRYLKYGFVYVVAGLVAMVLPIGWISGWNVLLEQSMVLWLPMFFVHTVIYGMVDHYKDAKKPSKVFEVKLKVKGRPLVLGNIRRGVSVMASAGSGKTESVIYGFLAHFKKEGFSGVIHDYKDFEITEMA
ncbi:MAG: mobilization protein, partial [Muricauda sp.]|nr:mobilization protein [Allomuricauda sp.]